MCIYMYIYTHAYISCIYTHISEYLEEIWQITNAIHKDKTPFVTYEDLIVLITYMLVLFLAIFHTIDLDNT